MEPYSAQIAAVREIAAAHVLRCGGNPALLQQSLLFVGDLFVGVRFIADSVEARWLFGSRLVDLQRNGMTVARIPLGEAGELRSAA